MTGSISKLVDIQNLEKWRNKQRDSGRRCVVTNGCFDIMHAGHVHYLEAAKARGDVLLVGVNSDSAVRTLKGPTRPINSESDRALVLAALACVDAVCIFHEQTADKFLAAACPDVYVKGGDYTPDTLNPIEKEVVEKAGGQIVIIPLVPGKSTTSVINRIKNVFSE